MDNDRNFIGCTDPSEPVAPAHLTAVLEGLAQAQRREFVSDVEVEAAFRCLDR